MLLAPFSFPDIAPRSRDARTGASTARNASRIGRAPAPTRVSAQHRWLIAWLIAGTLTVALFPFARGGDLLGASLPFWLIGAPLINLAWLRRDRLVPTLAAWRAHRRPRRGAQARALHRVARRPIARRLGSPNCASQNLAS